MQEQYRPISVLKRAALAAVAVGAITAGLPSAASAAEACANEAVRIQQGATDLPNCMAYERISPADKNGAPPRAFVASPDGNSLLFLINSALEGSQGFIGSPNVVTRQSDDTPDWAVAPFAPPMTKRLPGIADDPTVEGTSSNLDRAILSTTYPVVENDRGGFGLPNFAQSRDLYLREKDGSFTWLVPDPSVVDESLDPVETLGGSADLSRVVLATTRAFDPRVTTTDVRHAYVWSRLETHLATVLPDGSVPTGVLRDGGHGRRASVQTSADARRVAFENDDGSGVRVYVRFDADDPATAVTREVALDASGATCAGAQLERLSEDGHKLLYSCMGPGDTGEAEPVFYLRDLDGGPGAVRRLGSVGRIGGDVLVATEDLSRVYIFGLADVLYVSRDGGALTKALAPRDAEAGTAYGDLSMSSDGEYLAFRSARAHEVSGVDTGAALTEQVYRYQLATDTLICVSCRQDGSPTEGPGGFQEGVRGVSGPSLFQRVTDDGTVAFSSTIALDRRDTNGVQDAYAWIGGRQVLLSAGTGEHPSASAGVSDDGRTVFLMTTDALTPNDRDGSGFDIYGARVGGGFLFEDEPAPCTANCQDPGPERPGPLSPGSAGFVGGGSVVAPPRPATPRTTVSLTGAKSVRGSRTTVRVKVSRAGVIRVSGSGLRTVTVRASKAATYRVTARLSASGAKRQKRSGRLVTRVTARFTPKSGLAVRAQRSITFTGAKKQGGR